MKNPALLFLWALPLALALPISAQQGAQASPQIVSRNGKPLEQVEFYNHRRKLYIDSDAPDVVDLRRRQKAAPNWVINIPPLQEEPADGTAILTPQSNGLSPSGFGSNIPKGGFAKPSLTPVRMGGLSPLDNPNQMPAKTPPRGVGLAGNSKEIKTSTAARPVGAAQANYANYASNTGSSGSTQTTSVRVDSHLVSSKPNRQLLGK